MNSKNKESPNWLLVGSDKNLFDWANEKIHSETKGKCIEHSIKSRPIPYIESPIIDLKEFMEVVISEFGKKNQT